MPIRIAPTQTRIIPILLSSLERIPEDVKQLDVELTWVSSTALCQPTMEQHPSNTYGNAQPMIQRTFVLRTTLPLTHVPLWTQEKHVPIQASYFFAKSMPSVFVVKPPKEAFGDSQTILGQRDNTRCRGNEPILALRKFKHRLDTMIDTCDLNAHLTDSRWCWCRHPHPVILARLASATKVRVGCDAAGTDRLGELAPSSSELVTHRCLSIGRDSIGTVHQRPMHSQLSLPSRVFYPAPVSEDGPSGASTPTRVSSSWATRMVDKAHGTWRVDGPIAC